MDAMLSMVRDLVDVAVRLVKDQKGLVKDEAVNKANEKLVKLLVPSMKKKRQIIVIL